MSDKTQYVKLTGRITDSKLLGLKPEVPTVYSIDGDGLTLRVSPGGKAKSWVLMYRVKDRPKARKRTLGRYPAMGLRKARLTAETWRTTARSGRDPAEAEDAERERIRNEATLAELARVWFDAGCPKRKGGQSRPNTIRAYRVPMERYVLPRLGRQVARDVTRAGVQAMLDRAYAAGGVTGNRTLKALKRLYNWAAAEERITALPLWVVGPDPVQERFEETPKDVYLEADALRRIWTQLEAPGLGAHYLVRQALRLMLVTGQRCAETVSMRAEDVRGKVWHIPPERTKNGRVHEVPLTGLALAIINETRLWLHTTRIRSPWMFPSPRNASAHITPEAIDRAVKRNATLLGEGWTPHVLRASCATWMDELGVATNDIALVLNHKPPGQQVTHRYMRRQGIERKLKALEKWERFLREECGVGALGEVVRLAR